MRLALTNKIDIVFCGHMFMAPLAMFVAKTAGAKLWIQVHGIEAWQRLSIAYQRALSTADLVTSVSRYTRRRLLQWTRIDPRRVKVIPNTVQDHFKPGRKSTELVKRHGTDRKKVLLTVSRLASGERYKGHDRVIKVLPRVISEVPNLIYLIVGDGDDRDRLETLAENTEMRAYVEFVGQVPSELLPDYFRLADLFVMPSTGEGFGIVFVEALASGLHVIGGNRDGSLDALGDGRLGWTIEPESEEELARAICAALREDPADAVQQAARFGAQFFAQHLCRLVGSLRD
jgi:phosphatidylinositol alpha-1,6-mannosyltransferase